MPFNYSYTFYFLVKILLVKLKNLHTSACLKLNYCATKHKPKLESLQRWCNLSKLVTNTLVNFGNYFNHIILSPLFLLRKKYLQKMLFGRNKQFPSVWGIMIRTLGEFCLGAWIKLNIFNFLTHICICSSLNTINLKLFGNHGGISRFRRKFKKDSGEIKPLRVHRNMIIGNWHLFTILLILTQGLR